VDTTYIKLSLMASENNKNIETKLGSC
jgi:hypothetical protein